MTQTKSPIFSLISLFICAQICVSANANTTSTPPYPIDHCYHWINEARNSFLSYKYDHANKNRGELSFYSTEGNGAVAGSGLYCAKTPITSWQYGDRVIRIDLVPDVVLQVGSTGHKLCGHNGKLYKNDSECNSRPTDILHYDASHDYYVIKNPQAVLKWSAKSDQLEKDLAVGRSEADSSVKAHIDQTLIYMQADRTKKVEILNEKRRMALAKILEDPTIISQFPPLSLIAQIQADTTIKDKAKHYESQIKRALLDTLLSYSEFEEVIQKDSQVRGIFLKALGQIAAQEFSAINIAVVLTAIDKNESDLSASKLLRDPQTITNLWTQLFKSSYSFDSLTKVGLRPNGIVRASFDKAFPQTDVLQNEKNLSPKVAISLIKTIEAFSSGSVPVKNQIKFLFKTLLKSTESQTFANVFATLKNSSIEKEKAFIDLVQSETTTQDPFNGYDPIVTGLLVDSVKGSLPTQAFQTITEDLLKQTLLATDKMSFILLHELKNGRIKLPSFMTETTFVAKLVERSINERRPDKSTSNTFRLVLSGTYDLFMSRLEGNEDQRGSTRGSDKQNVKIKLSFKAAAKELVDLALRLHSQPAQQPYAYIALQNAGLFGTELKPMVHPIEAIVSELDPAKSQEIIDILGRSLDSSLLSYLVESLKSKGPHSEISKTLLASIIAFTGSRTFENSLKDDVFKIAEREKRLWKNIVKKPKAESKSGGKDEGFYLERVSSSLCAFSQAFEKYSDVLKTISPEHFSLALRNLGSYFRSECDDFKESSRP
ncbi:MAG: hypothetical protein JNM39_10420 [Bdellovibrionaceae bacterium]|nr:hypothetical protein [Pseudobdellovibrionaceae bacterium]